MKKILLPILLAVFFAQSGFATTSPKPEKCPDVRAIQSVDFTFTRIDTPDMWYSNVISNYYNTPYTWNFFIGPIHASNENEAKNKASSLMKKLTFQRGPLAVQEAPEWVCIYDVGPEYTAIAYSPAIIPSTVIKNLF